MALAPREAPDLASQLKMARALVTCNSGSAVEHMLKMLKMAQPQGSLAK